MLWLDIETTGLDPAKDHILEIYANAGMGTDLFREDFNRVIKPEGLNMATVDPVVVKMHEDNGLWKACDGGVTLLAADIALAAYISKYFSNEKAVLAGFSVGFDQGFLLKQMPLTAKRLHYRVMDVTSLLLSRQEVGKKNPPKLVSAHRARGDVWDAFKCWREIEGV